MKRWLGLLVALAACATAGEDADSGTHHQPGPADAGRVLIFVDAGTDAGPKIRPDAADVDADTTADASQTPDANTTADANMTPDAAGVPDARPCTQMQIQLLANANFDSGHTAWTEVSNKNLPIINNAANGSLTAISDPNIAVFGSGNNNDDTLSQSVLVPADATALSITGYTGVDTNEFGSTPYDTLTLTVAGTQLHRWSNADGDGRWHSWTYPIGNPHAGQTVAVVVHGITDDSFATLFTMDSLALTATVCR